MHRIDLRRLIKIIRRLSNVRILVVGDLMLDEYIWGKVNRISPEAPVPVVNVQKQTFMPGGAANVARNIKALGGSAVLCGVVGRDSWGGYLLELLRKERVKVNGVFKTGGNTILKTRVIAHSQQVVRIDKEKDTRPTLKNLEKIYRYIEGVIKEVDGVIIEDYGKGVITQDLVYLLVDICHKTNKPLIVDPKKGHMLDYTGVTAMTPNLEEALSIVGLDHNGEYIPEKIKEVGKMIVDKWGLQGLLITLGEHGMSLFEKGRDIFNIPAMAKEVYDVSGAGDTVVAVFTSTICSGADMRESALISNLAAGIVVGKVGTATATIEELLGMLKRDIR